MKPSHNAMTAVQVGSSSLYDLAQINWYEYRQTSVGGRANVNSTIHAEYSVETINSRVRHSVIHVKLDDRSTDIVCDYYHDWSRQADQDALDRYTIQACPIVMSPYLEL